MQATATQLGRPALRPQLRRPLQQRRAVPVQRGMAVRAAMAGAGAGDDPYEVRALPGWLGRRAVSWARKRARSRPWMGQCACPPPPLPPPLLPPCPPPHPAAVALRPQVLGIPRNADSTTIQRAYKKKLSEVRLAAPVSPGRSVNLCAPTQRRPAAASARLAAASPHLLLLLPAGRCR